jgi:hypothetical protein
MNTPWVRRWHRLVARPERGAAVSVLTAGLMVSAALFLGLVVDGGAKASALNRADATAQEAARAGSQAAATGGGGAATVDVGQAVTAAQAYLGAAKVPGVVTAVGADAIHVTVTITEPTKVLSMIGIHDFTTTGSADARILYTRGS